MNARTSLIPPPPMVATGLPLRPVIPKKESGSVRSRVLAAAAGVCGVVGVVALRANGIAPFAAEGEGITFDKVLAAQVRPRTTRKDLSTLRRTHCMRRGYRSRRVARVDRARDASTPRARAIDARGFVSSIFARVAPSRRRARPPPRARAPEPPHLSTPATPPGAPGEKQTNTPPLPFFPPSVSSPRRASTTPPFRSPAPRASR